MRHVLLLALALATALSLNAQTYVSGIFQRTDAALEYVEGLDWEQFNLHNRRLNQQGYRLIDLETSGLGRDRTFWGIYTRSSQTDTIARSLGWSEFVKMKRKMAARGYVLTDVTAYAHNETDTDYIGVWQEGKTLHKIWKLDSQEGLQQRTDEMVRDNYFLVGVKVVTTPAGLTQYLALYHHHPLPERNYVYITDDPREFSTDWLQRMKSNMRLIDYDRYDENGRTWYLGVYQSGQYEHLLLRDMDKLTFEDKWDRLEAQEDLRLVNWSVRQ